MLSMLVKDLRGRPVGYLEGDRLRDDSGKPVGERTGGDASTVTLSSKAASWMSGRSVLMDLAIGDVAQPTTRADFGIDDGDFIADKVSAVRYIAHDRGSFFAENASDAITLVLPNANSTSNPAELNPPFVSTSFTTIGYALAARIPRQVGANADFDVKARTLYRLVYGLRLAREVRLASLLTTSANWASTNRIAATAKWNGGVANPLLDMMNALQQSYLPANTMILPENVSQNFYVQPTTATGIRDYVQARGEMPVRMYARGKRLIAGVPTYIWAPATTVNVALVRVPSDPNAIASTITLRWLGEDASDPSARAEGMLVREFRDPKTDSDWLVVAHNDIEVIVDNHVGAIITGAQA